MMSGSAHNQLGTGIFRASWVVAIILGFSSGSLTQLTSAATPTQPDQEPATLAGEPETQVSPEDEPDANLVPVDTDPPAADSAGSLSSETNTINNSKVPRSEDLLQLNPASHAATARFSDVLNPPAEVTQSQPTSPDSVEPTAYNVPIVVDSSVQGHIRYFNTAIRGRFEQWLLRLSRYRPLVETIFTEFHLPSDLVYLSLVESGFNPYAYSRARATGPWQFMKGTAKLYGLRVDEYVDERRDPIKSTVAAARYLRDLYDLFGTWPLAMAAYNAGERKIQRALRKAKAETFWEIAQTKFIRRETREYVPRFMAAAIIAKNPDQYGFEETPADIHQFEEIVVSRPLPLRAIAAATDIPYAELHRLNPELRRDVTPPDDPAYHLKVPVGSRSTIEQALATIKPWTPSLITAHARKNHGARPGSYRVRMGDNLSKIAKRFRVTIEEFK